MDNHKTCFEHKDYHTGCISCQEDIFEEISMLKDQLRWRKYPEEKPERSGHFICRCEDFERMILFHAVHWYDSSFACFSDDSDIVTHWLPIPGIKEDI